MPTRRATTRKTTQRRKAAEPTKTSAGVPPPTASVEDAPLPFGSDPHVAKALKYIDDVLSGVIPASKYTKLACKRQREDLARFRSDTSPYYWDEAAAGHVCRFLERLPHVKGPKAKNEELIVLEPFQCFLVTTVFGWKVKSTRGRRFRKAYNEMARGNAKSTLSSGVAIYCTAPDGEAGAEVYSAATKHDQAKIVQGDAQAMLRKRPEFAAKLGFVVNQHDIKHPKSNSKFVALSRDSGSMDGLNVHCAIIDELHAHKERGVYDVIETACTKRLSSLLWIITTAGTDTTGICYEIRTYATKVLDGSVVDDSFFAIIYTLDEGDEWSDERNWLKANPNWGVSVYPEEFRALAKKAQLVLSARNNFLTKHLNIWCNADTPWMSPEYWNKCGVPDLKEEDFQFDSLVIGQDLATKVDIVSRAKLWWRFFPKVRCEKHAGEDIVKLFESEHCVDCDTASGCEKEPHFFGFVDNYLPEAAIAAGRNSQYEGWALEQQLISTPGDVLDFQVLKADTLADHEKYRLVEFAYDPWQSTQLAQELDSAGITCVEVRPSVINFSAPMKEIDALCRSWRFHHNASPVMLWMITNVVCHTDAKDNIYPRKLKPENKIDGAVALIMAMARAMVHSVESGPYSSTRGIRSL